MGTVMSSLELSTAIRGIDISCIKSKTLVECIYEGFEWCHRESNQGHKDFQSFALPTELWHLVFVWDCKGSHFFLTSKFFLQFC